MEFDNIIKLAPKKLYRKALPFKKSNDYDNYCIYMIMAANYGYKLAHDDLAQDYSGNELHLKQNYSKTKQFYETTKKYAYSMNYLGYMYNMGFGVERNSDKAKELYEMAIVKDNSFSMHNLAYMYVLGEGISQDYGKAKELFEKAISKDNSNSFVGLALLYKNAHGVTRDYSKTIELYEMAITKGNSIAMNYLASAYYMGMGVERDHNKAKELFEMAFSKGNLGSIDYLGFIYRDGNDVKDHDRAIELFKIGISRGNTSSMHNLAAMYKDGRGVTQDLSKARELYELAIEKNDLEEIRSLINLYRSTTLKDDKQYVIDYFLKIDEPSKLKEIYNYDDFDVQLIVHNNQQIKEVTELRKENGDLKTYIMASPDGELYFEAKECWNAHSSNVSLRVSEL